MSNKGCCLFKIQFKAPETGNLIQHSKHLLRWTLRIHEKERK